MIFRRDSIAKIRAGSKNQTRRLVKDPTKPSLYVVGGKYAVQPGRTKPGEFQIRVTGVRRERLGKISAYDLLAEGFSGHGSVAAAKGAFIRVWTELHGSYDADALVDVIDFVQVREMQES